jgi:general secretion pathway protein I
MLPPAETRGAPRASHQRGFTLLEVMVAIAILGISLLALLGLHHSSLQSVIRSQDTTQAVMLAQALMTEAELERFPPVGNSSGNFDNMFPGLYRNFQWQRQVMQAPTFPDVRIVKVLVLYGAGLHRTFALTEYLHEPSIEESENGGPAGQGGTVGSGQGGGVGGGQGGGFSPGQGGGQFGGNPNNPGTPGGRRRGRRR